jgi:hypothetical protein
MKLMRSISMGIHSRYGRDNVKICKYENVQMNITAIYVF